MTHFGTKHDRRLLSPTRIADAVLQVLGASRDDESAAIDIIRGQDWNPDSRDSTGTPLLFHVATRGWDRLLEICIARGCDPNIRHSRPNIADTALHHAKTARVAGLLLQAGTDPKALNQRGASAILRAAYDGRTDVMERILSVSDALVPDRNGQTPLSVSIGLGWDGMVDLLISSGTDPREPGGDGEGVFTLASRLNMDLFHSPTAAPNRQRAMQSAISAGAFPSFDTFHQAAVFDQTRFVSDLLSVSGHLLDTSLLIRAADIAAKYGRSDQSSLIVPYLESRHMEETLPVSNRSAPPGRL